VKASTEVDPKTLSWIKQEVAESLNTVRQELESFAEKGEGSALAASVETLQRVRGALEMIEITGAVMLAREMHDVLAALAADKIEMKKDAAEVLMRGVLQLPAYLEQLYHGKHDVPLILLPLLNDLRAVQNKELLTEGAFFFTDVDVYKPTLIDKSAERPTWDQRTMAKKLRPAYLTALLGVFRELDVERNLKILATVLLNIEQASTMAKSARIWWVGAGLIEALHDGGLELSVSTKIILGRIDRQIKRLIDDGEAAFQANCPDELIKNMLYYLAQSGSQAPRVVELKRSFKLDNATAEGAEVLAAREQLVGFNANLMVNVSAQIKEEMLRIKDDMDIAMNAHKGDAASLTPVCERLHTVADTLDMLGMQRLSLLAREQEEFLRVLVGRSQPLKDADVMKVASALLFIESALYDLNLEGSADYLDGSAERGGTQMAEAEFRELAKTVTHEVLSELARFKDAFVRFTVDNTQRDGLNDVAETLNVVRGVLMMLGYERVARVADGARAYLAAEVIERSHPPVERALDLFANVIGAIEYFLESLVEKAVAPDTAIELAERSLSELGYAVKRPAREPAAASRSRPGTGKASVTAFSATPETDPALTGVPMAEVDRELINVFLAEAGDELANIQACTDRWREHLEDVETLQSLIRSYHTLKGAGRIIGANAVSVLSWSVEELLRRLQDGRADISDAVFDLLERAVAALGELVSGIERGLESDVRTVQPLIDMARELRKTTQVAGGAS
jgi:chemosensory pili system protein ChpA (sensor histidine kinase/response regulator)